MLKTKTNIQAVRDLVKTDFEAVNTLIQQRLYSPILLIQEISKHIIQSGGKRLRPLLVLLAARALNCQNENHLELAAVIEFLHTATLLHDDVVDDSKLRRGKKTANAQWGNEASILVGDFLYSRAFQMMTSLQNLRVVEVLADATNQISSGEVLQLMNRNNVNANEENYFEIITLKTAKLFEVSAQLGAIAATSNEAGITAMTKYGLHFGIAYQLIDDILDFSADPEELGKNLGDDLAEGKPTLPLIYALKNGNAKQKEIIHQAILHGGLSQLDIILQAIHDTHALDYARKLAQQQINLAIAVLENIPKSPYHEALITLAHFAVEREM